MKMGENECPNRFNGCGRLALGQSSKRLFCARDRFGIKPFAYYYDGQRFIFGSEIKQILLHPIDKSLNMAMIYRSMKLNSFLCYGDETYFRTIKVLPHSHYLQVEGGRLEIKQYYDLDPATFETSQLSFAEAADQYRYLFTDAVRLRMRSDVEVGSCLSGGLDSSAVVGAAVKYTSRNSRLLRVFTE
jgi:asparagine synthase (glutamine-hydrolysing)